MERLLLCAYQTLELSSEDLGEQFTESGDEPRTLVIRLTTAMDEPFINRQVKALLTERDQRAIIEKLQANLDGKDL
jgi:hypothetical protein